MRDFRNRRTATEARLKVARRRRRIVKLAFVLAALCGAGLLFRHVREGKADRDRAGAGPTPHRILLGGVEVTVPAPRGAALQSGSPPPAAAFHTHLFFANPNDQGAFTLFSLTEPIHLFGKELEPPEFLAWKEERKRQLGLAPAAAGSSAGDGAKNTEVLIDDDDSLTIVTSGSFLRNGREVKTVTVECLSLLGKRPFRLVISSNAISGGSPPDPASQAAEWREAILAANP